MQRQTKIIATLGPAVASADKVRELVDAGMDVARVNFSHGEHADHRSFVEWVRQAARDAGRMVAVLQDIQGPKLRVGAFEGGSLELRVGDEVRLTPGESSRPGAISIGYENLLDDVLPGHEVVLADGMIRCQVIDETADGLVASVTTGGVLGDNKGVAFPDSMLSLGNITAKDEKDIEFG